jgi:hypothetical protein
MVDVKPARHVFLHEVLPGAAEPVHVSVGDIVRVLGTVQHGDALSPVMTIADPVDPDALAAGPATQATQADLSPAVLGEIDTALVDLSQYALTEGTMYQFFGDVTGVLGDGLDEDDGPVLRVRVRFARPVGDCDVETFYHSVRCLRAVLRPRPPPEGSSVSQTGGESGRHDANGESLSF